MATVGMQTAPYTGTASRNLDIPFPDDKVLLDVVFPDHTRQHLHSKTFVFDHEVNSVAGSLLSCVHTCLEI